MLKTAQKSSNKTPNPHSAAAPDYLSDGLMDDLTEPPLKRQIISSSAATRGGPSKCETDGTPASANGETHEGARHTAMSTDREEGLGSATVVTTSARRSTSADGLSTTRVFQGLKQKHPEWDDDALWKEALRIDPNVGGSHMKTTPDAKEEAPAHSTVAPIDNTAYARPVRQPRSYAWVVGNSAYTENDHWKVLSGAKRDADSMASHYRAKNYSKVVHTKDVTGSQMKTGYNAAVGWAAPGDTVSLYYAGHGAQGFLPGTDSDWLSRKTMPDGTSFTGFSSRYMVSDLASIASAAISKGIHVDVIVDACHSGGLMKQAKTKLMAKTNEWQESAAHMNTKTEVDKGVPVVDGHYGGSATQAYYEDRLNKRL